MMIFYLGKIYPHKHIVDINLQVKNNSKFLGKNYVLKFHNENSKRKTETERETDRGRDRGRKKLGRRVQKMTQWLRTIVILSEDPCSIPSTNDRWLTTSYISRFWGSDISGFLGRCTHMVLKAHVCACALIHANFKMFTKNGTLKTYLPEFIKMYENNFILTTV